MKNYKPISLDDLPIEKNFNIPDYSDSKVELYGNYTEPEYNLYIGDSGVFTRGNFSVITGQAKSMKTTLLSLLIAPYFTSVMLKNRFVSAFDGEVILFDTEQSKFHIHRLIKFSCYHAGITKKHPEFFHVYALRKYKPKERVEIICDVLNKKKNVNLAVIDGTRDLVNDINSAHEATEISSLLMKLTADKNCHIINILHQNPGDNKIRGHLGTELKNKSETIIQVEKVGKGRSNVTCYESRGRPFEGFEIGFLSDGLYVDDIQEEEIKDKL